MGKFVLVTEGVRAEQIEWVGCEEDEEGVRRVVVRVGGKSHETEIEDGVETYVKVYEDGSLEVIGGSAVMK